MARRRGGRRWQMSFLLQSIFPFVPRQPSPRGRGEEHEEDEWKEEEEEEEEEEKVDHGIYYGNRDLYLCPPPLTSNEGRGEKRNMRRSNWKWK